MSRKCLAERSSSRIRRRSTRADSTAARATDWPSSVDSDGRLSKHQTDFDDEVCSALREIGDVARACLLLRVVHQLSYEEIAETLEIPQALL